MTTESHTDQDHHANGVRGQVVQAPGCGPGDESSILSARPIESFTEPAGNTSGQHVNHASVAQVVERESENLGEAGSTPARGTKRSKI